MVVDFNYTTVGLEVTFTNLSTGVPEGYTYLWDFGDGTSSKELIQNLGSTKQAYQSSMRHPW